MTARCSLEVDLSNMANLHSSVSGDVSTFLKGFLDLYFSKGLAVAADDLMIDIALHDSRILLYVKIAY